MGLQFVISFSSPFLYMVDMIAILEVTPTVPSFPQETLTSERTGASSFEKSL